MNEMSVDEVLKEFSMIEAEIRQAIVVILDCLNEAKISALVGLLAMQKISSSNLRAIYKKDPEGYELIQNILKTHAELDQAVVGEDYAQEVIN